MSAIQKFITAILPRRWAQAMEAESRAWVARCPCGHARSVWELGGIRCKAAGRPQWLLKCPACGQRAWHALSRDPGSGG